jgi:DNA-binding NarL/FixJ family response regulator/two-component sensor histidine kinase
MVMHAFDSLLKTRREVVSDNRLLNRSGGELLVEWHGRPFYRADASLDFIFFVGIDVTERKRLEKMILGNSELERQKIGQELHERLGQNLAGLVFKSEILRLKLRERSAADAAEIEEIIGLIHDSMAQTRDLARDLCPVDMGAGGLFAAFEELRKEIESRSGVACLLDLDEEGGGVSDLEASNLYYIAREAVENALVHGRARNVLLNLSAAGNVVTMKVIDDGCGLPDSFEESTGVGIRIMRYRSWIIGAGFSIERNAGGGTVVTCLLRKHDDLGRIVLSESDRKKYRVDDGSARAGVLVVHDQPNVRQGLAQINNREEDLFDSREAHTAQEAMKLVGKLNPHLVIADISIDGASGIDLIKALRSRYAGLPLLVLSIYDEQIYAERTLRAGARGYVMKQEAPQTVVTAIRTVLSGKQYLSARVTADLINRMPFEGRRESLSSLECLTTREFEVFQYIGNGLANKHIAEKLNISVKTVENYRERIKNKLNLESASDVQWVIDRSKQTPQ